MLQCCTLYALKALLELAQAQETLHSVTQIAQRQQIPAPMLEQILLQLRRAGLVVARRGRAGGYGLAQPANAIRLEQVADAVGERLQQAKPSPNHGDKHEDNATDQVLAMLERRLQRSLAKALQETTLEELFLDLRSWQAILEDDNALML
ncbi:MAG: Rrf2 family transcriptional regulator [Synechococcus sp. SB0668_bin_15]|nr:Rrf2 family transcriptional regulator [Synechococcus sp. SB0668_bin_15]MYC49383.1 Rrf2 family transcriptional regulator [Synechococcus sp. SB0662_bin_14]